MTKSVLNAMKAVAVLVGISVVCVGVLAVCNMFFPKYTPKLDRTTASLINGICPTGEDDDKAFDNGYIVMLYESDYDVDLSDFNKANKSARAEILAVYCEVKGDNSGAYIIESKAAGRDSDIFLLVAYRDGKIVGAAVKKQNESYFAKLPDDLLDNVAGMNGDVDLVGIVGKTGATVSLTAINRALNLSDKFALDYMDKIQSAIGEKSNTEGER
ncbi:MAG: hypothetical protein J1G04_03085 [Clostridiales bacterium]|nr:hypothetical protein [Clostridiales bacterium]